MRRNTALTIAKYEWDGIMELPKVKKVFGLGPFNSIDDFASRVYGAKFKFSVHMTDEEGFIYTIVGNIKKGEVLMVEQVNDIFKVLK